MPVNKGKQPAVDKIPSAVFFPFLHKSDRLELTAGQEGEGLRTIDCSSLSEREYKMTFGEKLSLERRTRGMSQEQLADSLGVTRQSVSKWESNSSVPELAKLIQLSELFAVSVDYLVKDGMERDFFGRYAGAAGEVRESAASDCNTELDTRKIAEAVDDMNRYLKGYSYTSKTKLFGIPLVSIRLTRHGRLTKDSVAKGIIAIGNVAVGVISIGAYSLGLLSLGIISAGLLALGILALGVAAFGVVAVGLLALGVSVIGVYAGGMAALGKELAAGVAAVGGNAIGKDADGLRVLQYYHGIPAETVREFITQGCPKLWGPVRELFVFLVTHID